MTVRNFFLVAVILVFATSSRAGVSAASTATRVEASTMSPAVSALSCNNALVTEVSAQALTPVEQMSAYIELLMKESVLSETELRRFADNLGQDKIVNPIPHAATRAAHTVHSDRMQSMIDRGGIDSEALRRRVLEAISNLSQSLTKRQDASQKTQPARARMHFVPVPKADFNSSIYFAGGGRDLVNIQLTHAIEVMDTKVTQNQWVEYMAANPNHFYDTHLSSVETLDGKSIEINTDHPVKVSWWSAVVFANRLSEARGYEPVYDLSGIVFVRVLPRNYKPLILTTAEEILNAAAEGELQTKNDDAMPRINGAGSSIYRALGYRLPTNAEQSYLLEAAGIVDEHLRLRTEHALMSHAWVRENSDGEIQAVRELKPFVISGNPLFDLVGNLEEWANGGTNGFREGGQNPLDYIVSPDGVIEGDCVRTASGLYYRGDASNGLWHMKSMRARETPDKAGVRLVRTVE